MANANKNPRVVKAPKEGVQPVQPGNEQVIPQDTQGADTTIQETTAITSGQPGSSEQADTEENTQLDNPDQDKATETERTETGSETVTEKTEPDTVTKQRNRIAQEVFSKNDVLKVIYFTSDLVPFAKENDAYRHAGKLLDKAVVKKTKDE